MSDKPISRFPVPELTSLPDDIRTRILAVQEKAGFVPNVFLVLAQGIRGCRLRFAATHLRCGDYRRRAEEGTHCRESRDVCPKFHGAVRVQLRRQPKRVMKTD